MRPDKRDFEERYSSCFKDFLLKTAVGCIIGSMFGGFFFRGYSRWPMIVGGGIGVGMSYSNCENSLNNFLVSLDPKLCSMKKKP